MDLTHLSRSSIYQITKKNDNVDIKRSKTLKTEISCNKAIKKLIGNHLITVFALAEYRNKQIITLIISFFMNRFTDCY